MNSILLGVIAVVIILLIIVIVLILKNLNSSKQTKGKTSKSRATQTSKKSSEEEVVNNVDYSLVDIKDIELPKKIAAMDNRDLFKACKSVFDSFKALDYKNGTHSHSSQCEWHSWQVSLLIAFQKSKREFHVGKIEDVFDKGTSDIGAKALDEAIQKIWKKYNLSVNIKLDRNALSNDIIWTSREVSTMFYYMMKTKY